MGTHAVFSRLKTFGVMASYISLLALGVIALLMISCSAESPTFPEPIVAVAEPALAPSDPAYACENTMTERCKKLTKPGNEKKKDKLCKVENLTLGKYDRVGQMARGCKKSCGLCEYNNKGQKIGK